MMATTWRDIAARGPLGIAPPGWYGYRAESGAPADDERAVAIEGLVPATTSGEATDLVAATILSQVLHRSAPTGSWLVFLRLGHRTVTRERVRVLRAIEGFPLRATGGFERPLLAIDARGRVSSHAEWQHRHGDPARKLGIGRYWRQEPRV